MTYIQAYLLDKDGYKIALLKVPVSYDYFPEIPFHIERNGWSAILTDTNPVTYKAITKPVTVEIIKRY